METQRVLTGTIEYLNDGRSSDYTHEVEFIGEHLAAVTLFGHHNGLPTDTRGVDQALYRAQDGRLIVAEKAWSNWQGEATHYAVRETTPEDLARDDPELAREANMARPLTLDEALERGDVLADEEGEE